MPDEPTGSGAKLVWIVPPAEADKAVIFVQFGENTEITPEVQKALDILAREIGDVKPGGAICDVVGTCQDLWGCKPVSGGSCYAYFDCKIKW